MRVLIMLPAAGCRQWHVEAAARLTEAGHIVSVGHARAATPAVRGLDAILAMESRRFGRYLASPCEPPPATEQAPATAPVDLVFDLAGGGASCGAPVLTLEFCGYDSFPAGLSAMVASGRPPELAARIDGALVGRARPMVNDRLWLTRASDAILAGAISLIVQTVGRFRAGKIAVLAETPAADIVPGRFCWRYPWHLGKSLAGRALQKLRRGRRPFYWQVAYRLIDGPGVAETGRLDGPPFTVLPDDGQRFYADPFVIEHDGRIFLFVEEFPYARGRGVISVAELRGDGTFATPRVVLQEPHHLSYPQVFAHGGDIYMIPEGAAARELVLYRAVRFPDVWVRDTLLVGGRDINDATLLEAGERLWLVGTERFGYGSASDTMVVYSATRLRGPWSAHALNPVAIDHSAARPGGAFLRQGERIMLPVQNGSEAYGGGLGLLQIDRMDQDEVRFVPLGAILPGPAWARKGIHTLNRAGGVEVVDSAG